MIGSTIKHNPRKVIAVLRFRDLVAPTDGVTLYQLSVRTGRMNRDLGVVATPDNTRGQHELSKTSGRTVRCRGLSHHIDYTANTVTMSVPRACLGHPRRVSAGVGVLRMSGVALSDSLDTTDPTAPAIIEMFADDAHSPTVADNLVFSPRLRRG
ncbi:hypothetical protein GCM10027596_05500 [Nocardioides korecus]